jgi:uncharacterized protein YdbL (DUF1318 family)
MSATIQSQNKAQRVTRTSRRGLLRAAVAMTCMIGLVIAGFAGSASAQGKYKGKERGVYLLGQAKADSQVGEKPDGYLGLVDENASEMIKKMVIDTNERRKSRYEDVALRRDSSLESVLEMAGKKLAKIAKTGDMLLDANGIWTKKK